MFSKNLNEFFVPESIIFKILYFAVNEKYTIFDRLLHSKY